MENQNSFMEKLRHTELRRLVEEGSNEEISVIIQPNLPERRIKIKKSFQRGINFNRPVDIEPLSSKEQEDAEKQINEVSNFLEKLLGSSPHWLDSARSFVVNVTPKQLREIAQSPIIKAVWLNRKLSKNFGSSYLTMEVLV
ncbi:MAG: hypothetical protein QNJ54_15355 [Prochloraceae cyanobacterium]|nr:hypothetical protein [Prochloraceae cyanobacterium]